MDEFKANIVREVMRRHHLVSFADEEGGRGWYVTVEQAKRQKDNPELWEAIKGRFRAFGMRVIRSRTNTKESSDGALQALRLRQERRGQAHPRLDL